MEFNPKDFKITAGKHRGKKVIWLEFEYNRQLIECIKTQTKARWSQSQRK